MPNSFDEQLLLALAGGRATLLLGAGFSLGDIRESAMRRDKGGLKDHLVRSFRLSLKENPHDLDDLSMEDLVLYLETRAGIGRKLIEESIRGFLEDSTELAKLESFSLLRTLVERRPDLVDVIITTNWDSGIEAALAELPVNLRVVAAENDSGIVERGQITLYKIHGDISRSDPGLVISSADFDLFEKEHPLTVERLRNVLASRYLIVLGYSGRDDNFRRLIRHLRFDLKGRLMGGWMVCPDLPPKERLWTNQVGLRHVPATSQEFLREALQFATTDLWGSSSLRRRAAKNSRKFDRFAPSAELDDMASSIREKYTLRDAWVIRNRTAEFDSNTRTEFALSCFLEDRAAQASSIAVSTGRTVEYAIRNLETDRFSRTMTLYSTVVLVNSTGSFRDPSAIVDLLAAKFAVGKCRAKVLRISGPADMLTDDQRESAYKLAQALVHEAVQADIVMSSVRPWNWFGVEGEYSTATRGRTQPFNGIYPGSEARVSSAMNKCGVAAVYQMIPLSQAGEDVSSKLRAILGQPEVQVFRPSTTDLQQASMSRSSVVLAASHHRKAAAVRAVLTARMCNSLVIDYDLAIRLLEEPA